MILCAKEFTTGLYDDFSDESWLKGWNGSVPLLLRMLELKIHNCRAELNVIGYI